MPGQGQAVCGAHVLWLRAGQARGGRLEEVLEDFGPGYAQGELRQADRVQVGGADEVGEFEVVSPLEHESHQAHELSSHPHPAWLVEAAAPCGPRVEAQLQRVHPAVAPGGGPQVIVDQFVAEPDFSDHIERRVVVAGEELGPEVEHVAVTRGAGDPAAGSLLLFEGHDFNTAVAQEARCGETRCARPDHDDLHRFLLLSAGAQASIAGLELRRAPQGPASLPDDDAVLEESDLLESPAELLLIAQDVGDRDDTGLVFHEDGVLHDERLTLVILQIDVGFTQGLASTDVGPFIVPEPHRGRLASNTMHVNRGPVLKRYNTA